MLFITRDRRQFVAGVRAGLLHGAGREAWKEIPIVLASAATNKPLYVRYRTERFGDFGQAQVRSTLRSKKLDAATASLIKNPAVKQSEPASLAEKLLDQAIELTFQASDTASVAHAFRAARWRDELFFQQGESTMAATPARDTQSSKALHTPNALPEDAVAAITTALNAVLADTFALYLKTKNFHWHVSGPHFRDYHLLFDEQAAQVLATTDPLGERVRKIGGASLRSIGHIAKLQRVKDNDEGFVAPGEMLRELMQDNKALAQAMREAHELADEHRDVATASLLEVWIDEAENRVWFLFEASRAQPH